MPPLKPKIVVLIAALLCAACHRTNPSPITDFLTNKPAAVFVFLAPDCPLSQSYTLTLNRLQEEFSATGVVIYGVFSGNSAARDGVDEFVRAYQIRFPTLRDPDLTLADFFAATKTPEAFAVNAQTEVFYKGAVDNWAPALGEHRTVITEHYLQDAINSFLQRRPVPFRQTNAVGCFIERETR